METFKGCLAAAREHSDQAWFPVIVLFSLTLKVHVGTPYLVTQTQKQPNTFIQKQPNTFLMNLELHRLSSSSMGELLNGLDDAITSLCRVRP
jgi:hypothetical protein